jgi:hypothetical protein
MSLSSVDDLKRMNARIKIPEDLSRYADGLDTFSVAAENFDKALADLIARYPELGPRLVGNDRKLLSHLIVFANGKTVPTAALSQLSVSPGDELEIMFLASGG